MATVPTPEELTDFFNQGVLAGKMACRFGLSTKAEIEEVQARCAALHNAGTLDLFRLVESGELLRLDETEFFGATHFFCRILRELEATPARMMACVEALVARGGEDMAANQPNATFREWCTKDPRRARDVISMARAGDDSASRNLTFALEAINAIAEARQIALAYDDSRRFSAITALGRIKDDDPSSRAETFAAFKALIESGTDDDLCANMLPATAAILAQDPDFHSLEGVALVNRLVENPCEDTVHQAADVLWSYPKALKPEIVASLLNALKHLNPANKGTVNTLDLGLQSLMTEGHGDAAIAYVTELLSRPGGSLKLHELDAFSRSLVAGPPERLSRVIVEWLLLGTPRLCGGLAKIIRGRELEGPPLNLRAEHLPTSPSAQVYLCRKAIGWFFFKPITAASVLVSVLRSCDADTALKVKELLVSMLLVNYSCIRRYLRETAPGETAKGRVEEALAENEAYLAGVQGIPQIRELQPSEHQRSIERLRMADHMRDVQKQVHNRSILASLAKHSVLLYGSHSVTFVRDSQDVVRPMEMDLKPYSVSFETPRMELIDPVGLEYTLRVFRTERMAP